MGFPLQPHQFFIPRQDDLSEAGEMPDSRAERRMARPSRVSHVGRKSRNSERNEAREDGLGWEVARWALLTS